MKLTPAVRSGKRGFSLIEVLAAVAIIGIIVFLAIPNIIAVKKDAEDAIAVTNAEALNIAITSFITANGQANAGTMWDAAVVSGDARASASARYALVKGYLAYAQNTLDAYEPGGFDYDFGAITAKVTIYRAGTSTTIPY